MSGRSFMRDCVLVGRGDAPMFTFVDGQVLATLDRYAIIPTEEYFALLSEIECLKADLAFETAK